jgi:hypothetical protein
MTQAAIMQCEYDNQRIHSGPLVHGEGLENLYGPGMLEVVEHDNEECSLGQEMP